MYVCMYIYIYIYTFRSNNVGRKRLLFAVVADIYRSKQRTHANVTTYRPRGYQEIQAAPNVRLR